MCHFSSSLDSVQEAVERDRVTEERDSTADWHQHLYPIVGKAGIISNQTSLWTFLSLRARRPSQARGRAQTTGNSFRLLGVSIQPVVPEVAAISSVCVVESSTTFCITPRDSSTPPRSRKAPLELSQLALSYPDLNTCWGLEIKWQSG